MIVVDTSVLVSYVEASDALSRRAQEVLDARLDQPWAAASMTIAEFLVGPARRGETYLARGLTILDELQVTELALPAGSGIELARLRAGSGLRMPDCCVLLTAQRHDATLATFDVRLAREARLRGLSVADT